MSTPLYSVYIRTVFTRGVVLRLSSMAADPTQEELTHDFGLQFLLEAHHQAGLKPEQAEDAAVLAELFSEMLPRTLTLPADAPAAERITSSGEHEGRKLLSSTRSDGQLVLSLERNYRAFLNAAQHYIYYVASVGASQLDDEGVSSVGLAVAGRFPWLFAALRPGMHWESTAFSFSMYS
jgi:hypothetical protein